MKHTICTAAGRVTIEPGMALGRPVVNIRVSHIPGLPSLILPALAIEAHEAMLLSEALDLAGDECSQMIPAAGVSAAMPTRHTTLHDLDNTEALQQRHSWHLEFDLEHGQPFVWTGQADNEREAINLARYALWREGLDHTARVAICLERKT